MQMEQYKEPHTFTCVGCGIEFTDKKHKDRKYCSHACSKKGSNNPMWKEDDVKYSGLHAWVERQLTRPECCSSCGDPGKVDLANISGEYKRELTDWEWLCRTCHMKKDGRMNNRESGKFKKAS